MISFVRGDCYRALAGLDDGSVDLLLTDPPYGTTDLPWDKRIDLARFWELVNRLIKPAGVVVCFAAQPFATDLINANRRAFRYELIWEKTMPVGFLDANRRPLRAHENILVFAVPWKSSCYNPQMTPGRHRVGGSGGASTNRSRPATVASAIWGGGSRKKAAHYHEHQRLPFCVKEGYHPRSVLRFPKDGDRLHPTQKPLALCRWLVRSFSRPGDLVCDPYAGSGTTAVACVNEGRRFIGSELNPAYFRAARRRIAASAAA